MQVSEAAQAGGPLLRIRGLRKSFGSTEVLKGTHIAEIYSPDLIVAQQDLIKATQALERTRSSGTPNAVLTQERLLESARERLRLLQLNPEQIDAIAASEKPSDHITLYAPQDGVVTAINVEAPGEFKVSSAGFVLGQL